MTTPDIQSRKKAFEDRLAQFGLPLIEDLDDDYFWLDHLRTAPVAEIGRRMIILLSLAFLAQSAEASEELEGWFKAEGLWDSLTANEQDFVRIGFGIEEKQTEHSWNLEGAYILAWALQLVTKSPSPTSDISDADMDAMNEQVVEIGGDTKPFLARLSLRPVHELRDESLFYSAVTSYNNDVFILGGQPQAHVHPVAAFERDRALNWIFQFHEGIEESMRY
jgi:hypothetical protein